MFARMLTMDVKPGKASSLAAAVEEKVLPTLRKFQGFRDQLTMLSPDGRKMVAMSFWDSAPQAGAYESQGWPAVIDVYRPFADSAPVLTTYDLKVSTAYQVHPATLAA
jgi:hypothetical protein